MRYLHTMVRVTDLDASIDFYCNKLGLVEVSRYREGYDEQIAAHKAAYADKEEINGTT